MEAHRIILTSSALAHGRVNLRACGMEFFPRESLGKPSMSDGTGTPLRLHVTGLDQPIDTDLPTDGAGRPRWFFRHRAWVKPFVTMHGLAAGDQILIKRLNACQFKEAA